MDQINSSPPLNYRGTKKPMDVYFPKISALWITLLCMAFGVFVFIWFFCRIEPRSDKIAVLIHKTGKDLPSGQIIATQPGQKGIVLDVLPEGRYFRNPYNWGWKITPITDIPAGRVGVLTRLYGKDLEQGKIIAGADSKGIVAEILRPGKYRVNPYAYQVSLFDAISIRAGCVGVVLSQIGLDSLNSQLPENRRNTFLVENDLKGVGQQVLDPGTYYLNPYIFSVVEVNLQSQRFEMSGDDAITFLTMDGFTVQVEGTLEFAIERESAALLTHRVGDMEDIIKKIILPRARGFSRLEGSKSPAINYIVGETRQKFQNNLEAHLKDKCRLWGVTIKSVLARNIIVPEEIASIIRDREIAVQSAKKYEQQIEQAKSKAELTRQEMLAVQNKEKVAADTIRIRAIIEAKQDLAVKTVAANREFEVAKLENDAATFQAQAMLSKAEAERDVIRLTNKAQADVFAEQVKAFGSGINYAKYIFYQRIGPKIKTIISGDQPGGLGTLFVPFLPVK